VALQLALNAHSSVGKSIKVSDTYVKLTDKTGRLNALHTPVQLNRPGHDEAAALNFAGEF